MPCCFTLADTQEEGVKGIRPLVAEEQIDEALKQTLLCFVLVAPGSAHAFCSRYDFGPWPLLPGITSMPPSAWQVMLHERTCSGRVYGHAYKHEYAA